jgi:hypothetical protein
MGVLATDLTPKRLAAIPCVMTFFPTLLAEKSPPHFILRPRRMKGEIRVTLHDHFASGRRVGYILFGDRLSRGEASISSSDSCFYSTAADREPPPCCSQCPIFGSNLWHPSPHALQPAEISPIQSSTTPPPRTGAGSAPTSTHH